MATMIEQVMANPSQGAGAGLSQAITSGLQTGMALAQTKQQIETQKIQQQAAQEQLNQAKMNGVSNLAKAYLFAPNDAQRKVIRKSLEAYSATSQTPVAIDALEAISKDPATREAAINGLVAIQTGKTPMSPDQFLTLMSSSPELFKAVNDQMLSNAKDANKAETQLELQSMRQQLAQEKEERKTATADKRETYKIVNNSKKDFDKKVAPAIETLNNVKEVKDLLRIGGSISDTGAQRRVARIFNGPGVLTDLDVSSLSGGKSLLERGKQLSETARSGRLTEKNRLELEQIVNTLAPLQEEKIRKSAQREANSQAKASGIPAEEFLSVYNVDDIVSPQKKFDAEAFIKKAKAAGKTDAEISEYLKKRGVN